MRDFREYAFDKAKAMTQTKFDRPDGFGLKSRHEHQRQSWVFAAGTAGDCATGEGCHDAGSSREAGRKETRGAELYPFLLRQGRGADASGAGGMGKGSRAMQAQVAQAGSAVRAESQDAGFLSADRAPATSAVSSFTK
jgi:hypothetical protein